jgi:hypothetical protein
MMTGARKPASVPPRKNEVIASLVRLNNAKRQLFTNNRSYADGHGAVRLLYLRNSEPRALATTASIPKIMPLTLTER